MYPYALSDIRVHFVSNLDGADLAQTLEGLDQATTLFIVSSKSFSTKPFSKITAPPCTLTPPGRKFLKDLCTNIANAFVVKYGKKNVVLLTDDIIHGCIASGNPKALSFVIGHELGHIALKHNGVLRSWLSKRFKKLSRLDEYSADAVGNALVQDKTIAFNGLLLLTVGYAMMPYVNYETVIAQAQEVASNKYSKKAEKSLTHPLLLNRLYRILR